MKWILRSLAVVAVLAGVVWGIGMAMPKEHTVSRTLELNAPPSAVWEAITDYPGQVKWRKGMTGVVRGADRNGHEVWVETVDGFTIPLETEAAEPPKRLVRRIAGQLQFGGVWTYEIAPSGQGSTLMIREDGEVYSPLFRVVSRLMGHETTIVQFLTDLARKFGEEPRIK